MKTRAARIAAKWLRESAKLKIRVAASHGPAFEKAEALLTDSLRGGGKVLLFGNGGSAADAQHIAGEFVVRFLRTRGALPAIALTTDTSVLTAASNDWGPNLVFSRQVEALARPGDVVIAISTSGSSPNVREGIRAARSRGASVIGLTGTKGRGMARTCDVAFVVPSRFTPQIQESHIAIGHILCELVDRAFGGPGRVR